MDIIGRVDESEIVNVTVNFIGDGRTLQTYNLRVADMPVEISVNVVVFHPAKNYSAFC